MRSTDGSEGRADHRADPTVVVVAGPTAVGKTEVGIRLAEALNGEIVSADARQVYRWMDIGTAKPTQEEQRRARHHLIDVADPDEAFSAGRYAREASCAIDTVRSQGKRPILVGGSGMYLSALFDGFSPMPEVPGVIRDRLKAEAATDLPALFRKLRQVDPAACEKVHPNDTQRIVRGLEVYEATGKRLSDLQSRPPETSGNWTVRWFGLNMDRQALYDRIDARVDRMLEMGLVDEVAALQARGFGPELNALNTFGYREVFEYLSGAVDLESAALKIKSGTRHYAKRQLTWFRRETRIAWVDPAREDAAVGILKMLDRGSATP